MKYAVLLILSVAFFACDKKSKVLLADVTIKDEYTGESVPCLVRLTYTVKSNFGSYEEDIDLGSTDANGRIQIERAITKNESGFKLKFYSYSGYYGFYPYTTPEKVVQLDPKSENVRIEFLKSMSFYTLSLKNNNCSGPSDTLFVENRGFYAGCVDTILINQLGYTGFSFTPQVELNYIVKRGNQIDSFTQNHVLSPKNNVALEILY